MKIGDKVRFLSETGGGVVAGFRGKDIVLVEDEDGFQIPTSIRDVVMVDSDDYSLTKTVEKKYLKPQNKGNAPASPSEQSVSKQQEVDDLDECPITFRAPAIERKGGDVLSVYLAFVPIDIKEITRTRFETYIVNDCNYYIHYAYMVAEGSAWNIRAMGEVEPNTKLYVEEFGREVLNEMEHVAVQFIAYKRDKPFLLKQPVMVDFRIDAVKFYKLHTFVDNDFFEQPAMLHPVIENDQTARTLVVDAKELKHQMYKKTDPIPARNSGYERRYEKGKGGNPFAPKYRQGEEPVVVDLHASELLDTTAGMNPGEILNYQLDVFRRTLAEYAGKKGTKIVFIHGKGEGVLRRALLNELKYKYKQYTYQDASFQEYGYGATQVNIR